MSGLRRSSRASPRDVLHVPGRVGLEALPAAGVAKVVRDTLVPLSSDTCTATPTVAKSPTLRSSLRYVPLARSPGSGTFTSVINSAGSRAVVNGPWKKSSRGIVRSPREPCATTSAPIASSAEPQSPRGSACAKRSADGAEVAHDRVGDLRRRIAERPVTPAQEVGTLAVPVPYQSADSKPTVPHGEPVEAPAAIDVDHGPRRGEAELHERDQALASGEDLGLVAVALKDRERLVEIRRREVLEGGRVHENASSCRARPTRMPVTSTSTSWLRQPYRRRVATTLASSSAAVAMARTWPTARRRRTEGPLFSGPGLRPPRLPGRFRRTRGGARRTRRAARQRGHARSPRDRSRSPAARPGARSAARSPRRSS